MTKQDYLDIIKLLSALESWGFYQGNKLPDFLLDNIESAIDKLSEEVLK